MGSILGESPAAQKEKLDKASINANDLTGLIKRNGKKDTTTARAGAENVHHGNGNGNGKRKVEFDDEVVEVGTGKKARLSDDD